MDVFFTFGVFAGCILYSLAIDDSRYPSEDDWGMPWSMMSMKTMMNGHSIQRNEGRGRRRESKVSPGFGDPPDILDGIGKQNWDPAGGYPADEEGRHISSDTLKTISETLGAINTVGRYLVNYTRSEPTVAPLPERGTEDLPGAIYTISKNVFGRNVTDSIAPLVRVLPLGKVTNSGANNSGTSCTTPAGRQGVCEDLSNCPQLLLDLVNLRQSICFKALFVPGVCCPTSSVNIATTKQPLIISTTKYPPVPVNPVTHKPTYQHLKPSSTYLNEECGVPDIPKFRVVGGDESLPGRWPWMSAIFLHGPRRTEFWCGGSLISDRHVLTAAHCTKDTRQRPFSARQFTVRLGDIDLRRDDEPSSPQTFHVREVRAHPKFSRVGFYNDIAVLVLDKPVRRSRYVKPLCLPPAGLANEQYVGRSPTVVGWGTTYYGGKESTVQRQVNLPVWRNEECDKTYFQPINENFICAGLKEGGKDACQGDSGGPLMLREQGKWMQIGIVSFGNKCGEPGYPGVYTRVSKYIDWINKNMV
ncbi:proclotting enzyme-like [Cimex lectularius]|uniref:Proclotting enzyme n=1 Tax=Cimex lectularius TaxID=79782 RepID=A0A8I6RCM6_CIMLE|nr:proclotting enzyme-like [Cimex lectularius]